MASLVPGTPVIQTWYKYQIISSQGYTTSITVIKL